MATGLAPAGLSPPPATARPAPRGAGSCAAIASPLMARLCLVPRQRRGLLGPRAVPQHELSLLPTLTLPFHARTPASSTGRTGVDVPVPPPRSFVVSATAAVAATGVAPRAPRRAPRTAAPAGGAVRAADAAAEAPRWPSAGETLPDEHNCPPGGMASREVWRAWAPPSRTSQEAHSRRTPDTGAAAVGRPTATLAARAAARPPRPYLSAAGPSTRTMRQALWSSPPRAISASFSAASVPCLPPLLPFHRKPQFYRVARCRYPPRNPPPHPWQFNPLGSTAAAAATTTVRHAQI